MEKQSGLTYREQIEALSEEDAFEAKGDALFLHHEDAQARILWAFHRPSGSCIEQLQDDDVDVAIMGFNNSRLSGFERLSLVNQRVLASASSRQKISKRVRMLFRAMADDDFRELYRAVHTYPVYIPLSIDQLINGRKMIEEITLHIPSVNEYLFIAQHEWNALATAALFARLLSRGKDLKQISEVLEQLDKLESIHPVLIEFIRTIRSYTDTLTVHPLQKIALQKKAEKIVARNIDE